MINGACTYIGEKASMTCSAAWKNGRYKLDIRVNMLHFPVSDCKERRLFKFGRLTKLEIGIVRTHVITS